RHTRWPRDWSSDVCSSDLQVKPYLESVAAHDRFIPETARRLADPLFTDGLRIDRYHLGQFAEKRERFLQEVLQGLDNHSKAALRSEERRVGKECRSRRSEN